MKKNYTIVIENGTGFTRVLNGTYNVTSVTNGYDDTTLAPKTVNVVEGVNTYEFKVGATGNLTLHVTEDGTAAGTPVVGAKFIRCDKDGVTYGTEETTDSTGNAVLANVPFAATNAPIVYYKQTSSDGAHEFDGTLKNTILTTQTSTVEVVNTLALERTFNYTDINYEGLKIESATLTVE